MTQQLYLNFAFNESHKSVLPVTLWSPFTFVDNIFISEFKSFVKSKHSDFLLFLFDFLESFSSWCFNVDHANASLYIIS